MVERKRYNLLVTGGVWAATLQCMGSIELPSGVEGEDIIARFVKNRVDKYIDSKIDIPYDEYIEKALIERFGEKEDA